MKSNLKKVIAMFMTSMLLFAMAMPIMAAAEEKTVTTVDTVSQETMDKNETEDVTETGGNSTGEKAMAAAIAVGLAAAAGAVGMGLAIAKSAEGISRQPEAEGKIRTTLMLGLVFIETAIIYALVIAILIIFVL